MLLPLTNRCRCFLIQRELNETLKRRFAPWLPRHGFAYHERGEELKFQCATTPTSLSISFASKRKQICLPTRSLSCIHPPNLLSRPSGLCPGFLFLLGFRKNCGQRAWPLRGRKSPRV